MKLQKKLKIFGFCTLITGIVLVILAMFIPMIINALTTSGIKKETALSPDNLNQWKDIPGELDVLVYRKFHLFNCTNKDDVIYKGARPVLEEYGPFIYRDY